MLYLKRNFAVVPLTRIVEKVADPMAKPLQEIALTFDDGLKNHITIVYPILRQLELPATFFVCPGLIETGEWQWPNEVIARLELLTQSERQEFSKRNGFSRTEPMWIVELMKSLTTKERKIVQNSLRIETASFVLSKEQEIMSQPMTWEDLRSLDSKLITIGSHTMTHPILTTVEESEMRFEITESRRILEERLKRSIDFFCYPNGSFDGNVVEFVRKSYVAAVTAEYGGVRHGDDLYKMGRISADSPLATFAWRLHRLEG